MKQALIVANLAGFASFLSNDINLLKNKGYQVTYAANANKLEWSDTKRKLEEQSVNFVQIDFESKNPFNKQNIVAYTQVSELLAQNNFELIHCHTPIAGLIVRFAARKLRRKGTTVIYTTHGFTFTSWSSKKNWLMYYSIEKFASRFCDAIITINWEDFANAKKMHCKKVFHINGVGVNTEIYKNILVDREKYRASIGVDSNQIMVLSVGELSERKNHVIIIDAIAKLENKERFVYVICGNGIDGGTGEFLRQRAEKQGVNLKLLGFRFDIPNITFCSDIGAIPSIREGLGLAGVQSLAAGVPVIGTDVQGIRDYIIDGKNGYLCDPNDEEAYSMAILKLSDFKTRKEMENDCYKVDEQFDIKVSHKQMEDIYNEILKQQ